VAASAAVLGLAGCAEETPGAARPEQTSDPATTTSEQEETTTSAEEEAGGLTDVEPCDLLPVSETTQQLGLSEGTPSEIGQGRACRWRYEGATLDDSFTVDLVLYDERGIDDVVGTNIVPTTIGGHDAVTFNDSTGGCIVSIAVGDTARADSLATGGNLQRGCELASQLAAAIEPQLP
jgi:hypothetical protein